MSGLDAGVGLVVLVDVVEGQADELAVDYGLQKQINQK